MVKTGLNEKQIHTWLTQRMDKSEGRAPASKLLSTSSSSSNLIENSQDSSVLSTSTQFAISGPTPSKKRCVEGMIRSPSNAQRKLDSAAFTEGGGGKGISENQPPSKEEGGWTSRAGGLRPVARFRPKADVSGTPASNKAVAEAKRINENKIVFRIESSDGFFLESENIDEAWINITAKIQWGRFFACFFPLLSLVCYVRMHVAPRRRLSRGALFRRLRLQQHIPALQRQ